MNPRQKHVLLVGIVLVGLAALYPPWLFVDQYFVRSSLRSERLAGYHFYFAPPAPSLPPDCAERLAQPHRYGAPDARSDCFLIASSTRIDTGRLAVEWVTIVLVVAGLWFLLRSQAASPRRPEGPPTGPNAATGKATGSVAAHPDANASTGPPRSATNSSGDGASVGRIPMPQEKLPTEQSTKPFEALSDQQKQPFLQEVKRALEDDQRLRQQFLQEPRLESRPPRASEPTKSPLVDPGSTEAQKPSSLDAHPPTNVSRNPPKETAKASQEIQKFSDFLQNADPQEFSATIVAIFRGLKMQPRHKEDVYFWLVENRHRFAGLVYGDDEPRDSHEAAMVARAKRLLPDLEKSFNLLAGKNQEVTSPNPRVAPHWAIAELLDRQVDLDALAEEAMKKVPTDRFITEHDPILFLLDRQNPQLPPWLPEEWERPLSFQERAYWFDLLLRFYSHSFTHWPPRGDKNSRLQEVVTALYHMYRDSLLGALPPPSFIDGK